MSDIDMEMSPKSETGSDHSEGENPPTPGSYGRQDGELNSHDNSEHEESDQETKDKVTADDKEDLEENDLSDKEETEDKDSVISPILPISPVAPISPISPNRPDDDEEGNEGNDDVENTEQGDDADQDDNVEKQSEKDTSEDKHATNLPRENTQSDDENLNDLSKEETAEVTDDVESANKEETNIEDRPEGNSKTSSLNISEGSNSVEAEDDESKDAKNSSLEESDLLNITEISDLSVDLTGDEEAIVDDILQNVGDGELLPGEEKSVAEDQEQVPEKSRKDNDDENEEPTGGAGELINDIFGSSDEDDDEDFEGFEDDEVRGKTKIKKKSKSKPEKKGAIISDDEGESEKNESQTEAKGPEEESMTVPPPKDSDSEDDDTERKSQVFISDFDQMMQQKKEENRKAHRRRKNVDIISDNDDLVVGIIKKMQEAAQEDRVANEAKQAATKKLKMLPSVLKHMLKIDLMVIFVDCNVLPVLKDWISPLPDGSLPHIQIREAILKILEQLPPVDSGALKVSGIGKAVMYLFRHPKETRKNKERAGKIISEWSRPIFGVTANFKSMSREEREERDYVNMSKRRRLSSDGVDGGKTPKRIENAIKADSKALRPGEKGWCMRARVPAPSNKDYVVRPKSNVEYVDFTKTSKKALNRFEKQKRKMKDKKGGSKQRAVEISLEGRKMAL